ncbi:MAG: hypothetical protein MUF08_00570 [Burkholderiaceae bacterium]|jgi:hypothetical protein|nr:hypothetical protein [Burkholderiaceae bacterium]
MTRISKPAGPRNGIGGTQASIRNFMEQKQQGADDEDDDAAVDGREKLSFVHLQSTVAEAGVQRPAGVAASVFDAGRLAGAAVRKDKRPRVKAPPLPDIASIVIEADVPVGPPVKPRPERLLWEQVLQRMQPGASVVLHDNHARSLALAARKSGVTLTLRRITATETRVWRLDPARLPTRSRGAA